MARVSKINAWFYHYTNDACPSTFLNATASVIAAGYKTTNPESIKVIGCQNFTKLNDKISAWMDEAGLSESALKLKLLSLLDAKETKFFQHEGKITDEREVEALETQRRTLDMAFKIKDMYAAKKIEHTGKDGGAVQVQTSSLDIDAIKGAMTDD